MRKDWTNHEIEILTEMYKKGKNVNKIAKELCRSKDSVVLKAKRLGLKSNMRGRYWTPKEETDFTNEWVDDSISNAQLMKFHNRTWKALSEKALKLGLGVRPLDSQYLTVQDICNEMNVSDDRVYAWIKVGLRTYSSNNKRTKYMIKDTELLSFLEHHQELFNANDLSTYLFHNEPDWLKEKRKTDMFRNTDNHQFEWSFEEDALLLSLYNHGYSISDLAKRFKRNEPAIRYHLYVLGCERKKPNEYTEKELEVLKGYSDYKTLKELTEMLPGRTESGLEYKCKMLGLPYHTSKKKCKEKLC